jgi:hypothetical protein
MNVLVQIANKMGLQKKSTFPLSDSLTLLDLSDHYMTG